MRWKCTCSYDGSSYAGWQKQQGQTSVQQVIEEVLTTLFKEPAFIQGSGRTDAGVHALEQVFHFDREWRHGGESLVKALHALLPKSIRVESAAEVGDDFHSRFSAVSKRYRYCLKLGEADPFQWAYCWPVPASLDLNLLGAAMQKLLGKHDFAAFASSRGNGLEYETTVRHITEAKVEQDSQYLNLMFRADGFMYKMVRSLAGTVVNVGLGRLSLEAVDRLLESAERIPLVQAAPAKGLYLEKVFYS
ncbi:tRNA pseudouridine(38-40) synthase TruA [Pelagicoccus sp. SDUM812002]|uniref:tRNA pseudouridine(38-40) synthase TruA n=1 Tax=Pelagicoccus sp. SDUM812002 TaxID=3041266 RepID=UPI00280FFA7F|nr:tRNA pseudouridine(38-40) synthase TruA [Pelagicoccus sp. SDUM812002]MDQ8184435.1 tRNA pseudouridine(38-40) synthase TruA [Pelagicoccus sp. SDUM812002]